jgi:hypothetical protein
MIGDETAGALKAELPQIHLPVDRWQALMRGMWRALAMALAAGGCFAIWPNWTLLWRTEKASFVALLTVLVFSGVIAIGLAVSAGRWLLVAAWWGPMGIEMGPRGIQLRLGPAGNHSYSWDELRFVLDEAVDWEMLDMMPDDAFVPRIIVRATGIEIGAMIVRYSGITHEESTRHIRPYLRRIAAT